MIILTHCGKLGDFLTCMPIGSWLYKTKGEKIHWVLTKNFPPFHYIEKLLRYQAMTGDFTLVDHKIHTFDRGGQPYKFDPAKFGITGQYYNLGLRGQADRYVTAYMAQEHGLNWDRNFKIETEPVEKVPGLILTGEDGTVRRIVGPRGTVIKIPSDLYDLSVCLKSAEEVHTGFSGLSVLSYFLRIHQFLYSEPAEYLKALWFNDSKNITYAKTWY